MEKHSNGRHDANMSSHKALANISSVSYFEKTYYNPKLCKFIVCERTERLVPPGPLILLNFV